MADTDSTDMTDLADSADSTGLADLVDSTHLADSTDSADLADSTDLADSVDSTDSGIYMYHHYIYIELLYRYSDILQGFCSIRYPSLYF